MNASRTVCSRCSSQLRSASVPASASAKRLGTAAAASYSTATETPDISRSQPNSNSMGKRSRYHGQRKGVNAFGDKKQPDEDPALALFKEVVSPKDVVDTTTTNTTTSVTSSMPILNE